ncbi:MAG: YhdH/YhfP family quinone oxidoreductase [Pirellulales bacterium]
MTTFPAFVVRKSSTGDVSVQVEQLSRDDLPAGEVLIEVAYSSLNYKDALASRGHPGVVQSFPHVPGIDCAGRVVESSSPDWQPGQEVLVTGYELGASHWGGYSQFVRVPAEWVVAMPPGLDARGAMIYGTAGFTAAQCVAALQHHGITPDRREVLVTGATGGVGIVALAILAKLGYRVSAVSGKPEFYDLLRKVGAVETLSREALADESDRPLLKARWVGAVDTVGGRPLANIVRSIEHRGCVAACGLVAGDQVPLTVYPFLLRGVTLAGIDSAKCPRDSRLEMWRRLAGEWRVELPEELVTTVDLKGLPERIEAILAGKVAGRTLVVPRAE